ncbi:inorganic pyrophosphatase [Ascosphaera apis ARSEF 7405]|uniref:Inorganic pyrophosphatase n=1 Tax=Ascosphaera apis ARSEF 7405 TaxID=392613 RepID=A0A166P5P9_9EURO|nr:inorganic pyrophosphatase [Ascosphaera apis ARSEF 7405]
MSAAGYSVRKIGAPNTTDFRAYIEKDGQPVSAFHDVPLWANEEKTVLNMVVEIPRWTNAKLEVGEQKQQALDCLRTELR